MHACWAICYPHCSYVKNACWAICYPHCSYAVPQFVGDWFYTYLHVGPGACMLGNLLPSSAGCYDCATRSDTISLNMNGSKLFRLFGYPPLYAQNPIAPPIHSPPSFFRYTYELTICCQASVLHSSVIGFIRICT